jgi:hypothetical protein
MPLFEQDNCQDYGLCPESSLGLDSFSRMRLALSRSINVGGLRCRCALLDRRSFRDQWT